jgi:anthranilate synthase component 1
MVPVWTELLSDLTTPLGAFLCMAGDGPGVLLESVERSERWGRYSFVAGAPAATILADGRGIRWHDVRRELPVPMEAGGSDLLGALKSIACALAGPRLPELPALTGGFVGYLAYEAAALLDELPHPGTPPCPPIALHVVDRALVFDHWRQRLLLVAHVPSRVPEAYERGIDALEDMAAALSGPVSFAPQPVVADDPAPLDGAFRSSMSPEAFVEAVGTAKAHILAGDIFQVVLSRRTIVPAPDGALPVYRRLRITNPAPYMFFLRMGDGLELAGSSPEPLVRVQGRTVSSRPIAGTRRRGATPEEDVALERDLLADPKERAEHAMLVDLARNDLGRVCTPGTVRPTELMGIERFSQVMHIVSTVEGELREGLEPLDALAATFPAGTVTGAPKRRAMEIIAHHEPVARGPYAGAVGYLTFAGDLDVCITIRTAISQAGTLHVQSGAGIVHDSDPAAEYRETEAKASAVLAALGDAPR